VAAAWMSVIVSAVVSANVAAVVATADADSADDEAALLISASASYRGGMVRPEEVWSKK
jgi:hypothetical protein